MQKMRWLCASVLFASLTVWLSGCNGGGDATTAPAVTGAEVLLETLWGGSMSPGDTLQLRLVAKDLPGVFQASFRLVYDTSKLRYVSFQPGSYWIKDSDPVSCRQLLSQVRDFAGSGTLLVVVSRPGTSCGNTDKVNGEIGKITMNTVTTIGSPAGLARFTTDETRLLVRSSAGTYLTLRQRTDAQLSFTPAGS